MMLSEDMWMHVCKNIKPRRAHCTRICYVLNMWTRCMLLHGGGVLRHMRVQVVLLTETLGAGRTPLNQQH